LAKPSKSPLVAIVGRPNVGKSTLFNRMVGSRRSIVGDEPGITRDRIYGVAEWAGREVRLVDTGGIIPEDKELIPAEIFRQARVGLEEAAAVIMVIDGRSNLTGPDMELARLLQRGGKPLFLAVNKIDHLKMQSEAEEYRRLGIREVHFISAEHGLNVAELLEAAMDAAGATKEVHTDEKYSKSRKFDVEKPEEPAFDEYGDEIPEDETARTPTIPEEIKIAIIGRPNVGKSTLLNRLTNTERAIVSPIAGTTRDAVDELVIREGRKWRFVDTAGIRRKGKTHLMAEKLSVVMARKHLETADVALLIIDATEGVTSSDATIGGYAHESGRSVIVVVNKWDLVGNQRTDGKPPADRELYEEQLRRHLKFLDYAPIVFVSAASGKNADKIYKLLEKITAERFKRVTTGQMNRFIKSVDFKRASVPARSDVRIYYMTQSNVAPPTFILFTDKDVPLHFSYQRFLENQIREAFSFEGTPIWIKNRARKKREYIPKKKRE
jgi:GTP-binding protein